MRPNFLTPPKKKSSENIKPYRTSKISQKNHKGSSQICLLTTKNRVYRKFTIKVTQENLMMRRDRPKGDWEILIGKWKI